MSLNGTLSFWVVLATIINVSMSMQFASKQPERNDLHNSYKVSINALHLPSNELSPQNSENIAKIELIDVKCDKNENGMHVTVQFSQPFDGIIYSRGYFNDQKCRYVAVGENEKSYNFVVPFEGCGSKPSCSVCNSVDNILIIQHDEEVQGEYDTARKISCSRTGIDEDRKVFFKPFIVDMLDVVTVPTSNGGVDCWMDIQRGAYPKLTPVGDVIKIGEELTVLVYLRDEKNEYDLSVRNCWAYNDEDFDGKNTGKVQLSDASGCSMKRKLFGSWRKTHETGLSGANLLLHNTLRAFKFPDKSQIYLKCDIEICRGTCAEAICDADEINLVDCAFDPLNPKCIRNKLLGNSKTSFGFTASESKPIEQFGSLRFTTRVPFDDTTKISKFDTSATERFNVFSTTISNRDYTTHKTQFNTEIPESTTFKEITTYPNVNKITTVKPGYGAFCDRYPNHKRCSHRVTDELNGNLEILTFKPPSPFATIKYGTVTEFPSRFANCALNPNDSRCQKANLVLSTEASQIDELPFNCKGKVLDPRCPNPTPTATPPTYLPPSSTVKPKTTTKKFFICVPGSNDVRCDVAYSKATEDTTTAIPSRDQYTTKKQPEKPNCYFGSTNPECRKVSTDILTFKPRGTTTSIPLTTTTSRTITTSRAPICYPGSLDPRCSKLLTTKFVAPQTTTTQKSVTEKIQSTTRAPLCYPGSLDPRCPKTATPKPPAPFTPPSTRFPVYTTVKSTPSTTRAPLCYPGSLDPRCKQTTTRQAIPSTTKPTITETTTTKFVPSTSNTPRCYPGSLDPRCLRSTTSKPTETTFKTAQRVTTFNSIPSTTTRAPICYPGSLDPRCAKTTTTTKTIITSTQAGTTEIPQTTTRKAISSTFVPRCYPGSFDPACLRVSTTKPPATSFSRPPQVTTSKPISSAPICYPGALDPRCTKQTTTKKVIPTATTTQTPTAPPSSTTPKTISSTFNAPRCYPGSLDPRCVKSTTAKAIVTEEVAPPVQSTQAPPRCYPGSFDPRCSASKLDVPLKCGPGPLLDPRCPNPTPTAQPATYLPPFPVATTTKKNIQTGDLRTTVTDLPETTTRFISIPTTTQRPTYTTKSPFTFPTFTTKRIISTPQPTLTTRLIQISTTTLGTTTTNEIPTTTTDAPTTERSYYTTTSKAPYSYPTYTTKRIISTPQPSLTTRFVPIVSTTLAPTTTDTPTTTQVPTTTGGPIYTTSTKSPFSFPTFTTKRIISTLQPNLTTRIQSIPTTTTTIKPTYTTKTPFTFPTSTTKRIISSPQPFNTRPTISTTTENLLCYPGSPIEGCKSTYTTPSFCFPGSKDKRCPQLPPSFSTRQPATYLPPFLPNEKLNRVRRQTPTENEEMQEIVKFSLSFKPFKFS